MNSIFESMGFRSEVFKGRFYRRTLALGLAAMSCDSPRDAEVGDTNLSKPGKQEVGDGKTPKSVQPKASRVDIEDACERFCDKLILCKANGKHCREGCIEECVEEAPNTTETEACVDAIAMHWRCQSHQDCENMGVAACREEQAELEKECFSDDPLPKKVVELPARKLRRACESMCERIDACNKSSQRFISECYEDCTPYPIDSEVVDPKQCVLTTAAWVKCRAGISCEELLQGKGCEQEKASIQCGA